MIPVAILFFLIGAVLAWGFRVWILVPITLLGMIFVMIAELAVGAGVPAAIGHGVLLGSAPQIGYAFGLLARHGMVIVRSPRRASVALLYKQRSIDQTFNPRKGR
jgi:hypothetical protein